MNWKRVAATGYVAASNLVGENVVTHQAAGEAFKFRYSSRREFVKMRNAINGGQTSEGIAVNKFRVGSEHDAVFDVGAHFGIYSVLLGVLNPDARLYAYEPADGPREVLIRNLELNGLWSDTNVSDTPVGRESGDSLLYRQDPTPGSEQHGVVDDLGPNVTTKRSVALSDVFDVDDVSSAWLKIDAEGVEGKIVDDLTSQDAVESLAGIIELHPDKLDDYEPEGILDSLGDSGYQVEHLVDSAPNYEHPRPIYSFKRR